MPAPSRPRPQLSASAVAGSSATLAVVHGDVDVSAADHLCNELLGYLDHGGRRLLIDLSEVTFLDAAAVNALLLVARSGVHRGILTVLVAAPRHVRRVLETLKLQDAIPLAPSVQAALALPPLDDEADDRDSSADLRNP
jgi:anti-sigma B factor antagonist